MSESVLSCINSDDCKTQSENLAVLDNSSFCCEEKNVSPCCVLDTESKSACSLPNEQSNSERANNVASAIQNNEISDTMSENNSKENNFSPDNASPKSLSSNCSDIMFENVEDHLSGRVSPQTNSVPFEIPNIPSESGSPKSSIIIESEDEVSDNSTSQSISVEHELPEIENAILNKANQYAKELELKNNKLENELSELKLQLHSRELALKQAELDNKAELLNSIEKLSKECNILRKEKETIVVRYANSEKDVIMEKKVQQELEKKIKELNRDRENLMVKIKNITADNGRLSAANDSKMIEIAKLQKNFEKVNADVNSREIRIKWLQNKLVYETGSHQETQTKFEQTQHRLNEMKEEAEQVRRDCQEMIKCYQEAEEIKSVKLDSQLKQKLSELEVQKQEKCDQEQVYQLLRQELEALKKKQRGTMEENNTLTSKIQSLEKERLEYEQKSSKLKDTQNLLKQEIVDLTARLAEMETLQLQLEREKEKSAASLREVDRLRLTNAELQADMNACHLKEGELLKFTEGVTDTNVKLQSAHSLLEVKSQAIEDELTETKKLLADIQQKYETLVPEMETLKKDNEDEVQMLARKLAEKTKNVEKLNIRLDEAENENRVLKRRHIASIKELSRELYECKKRLDNYESTNGIRTESASLGSRSSSTASLDVMNSNERFRSISPSPINFNGKKAEPKQSSEAASPEMPGIDKEMLIERIIKLQKTLARKNDKIDFLEDHIVQLVKEMRKKSKCVDFKTV